MGVTTQRILVDSLRGELEFAVPGFGGTQIKAAVLVVSLQDGPRGANSTGEEASGSIPIHVVVALRSTPFTLPNPQLVQATPNAIDFWPAWSPAGDELIFMSRIPSISAYEQIYRRRLDGSPVTRLAPANADQYEPDWSVRGDVAAFMQGGAEQSDIFLDSLETGRPPVRISFQPGHAWSPAIRPDGRQVAYIHSVPGQELGELRLIDLSPGPYFYDELITTTPLLAYTPALRWSPDGMYIYFIRSDSLYSVYIYGLVQPRLDLVGGRKTPAMDITEDGSRVVYVRPDTVWDGLSCGVIAHAYCGCAYNVTVPDPHPVTLLAVRKSPAGTWEPRFTPTGTGFQYPRFSWDGTRIAYSSDRAQANEFDLYVGTVNYDHAPYFTNLDSEYYADACDPFGISLSATDPDGESITYSAALLPHGSHLYGQIFQWTNPYAGDYFVVFRATDGSGGVATRAVTIHVIDSGLCGGELSAEGAGPSGWTGEGTVLGPAGIGSATDVLRLPVAPQAFRGRTAVRLVNHGSVVASVDQMRLIAVDHAPGSRVFRLSEGFAAATPIPAAQVLDRTGANVTTAAIGATAEPLAVADGESLFVSIGSGSPAPLLLELRRRDAASSTQGILVQSRTSGGGWQLLRRIYPRGDFDRFVVDSSGNTVRLIVRGGHEIRFVGRLSLIAENPVVRTLEVRDALHSRLGDAANALAQSDGTAVSFASGDTVLASFWVQPVADGAERDWFLVMRGDMTQSSPGRTASMLSRGESADAQPIRFVLEQNRPNPFSGRTVFRFAVPQASPVHLEVFDLLGRRLRTIVSGSFAAGYHSVEWDRRDAAGNPLRPGVYLYRLTAGSYRDQKKMVLTP